MYRTNTLTALVLIVSLSACSSGGPFALAPSGSEDAAQVAQPQEKKPFFGNWGLKEKLGFDGQSDSDPSSDVETDKVDKKERVPFLQRLGLKKDEAEPVSDDAPKSALSEGTGTKERSVIIDELLLRRSVLPRGSSYEKVATAVLAANARAAEADLRAAKLRSVAASKNWLPTIGPTLSLNSLGDVVAGLIVDQVLFNNGRKKAERAFAKADVEVAAVALADDSNERVFTALGLYLDAQESREQAKAGAEVEARMQKFASIMSRRVSGGVSDPSDLHVTRQKLAEIENNQARDLEIARTAIAELNAMSIKPLDNVHGISSISPAGGHQKPLSVMEAEAERERAVAQAVIDRAGYLPGVKVSGSVTKGEGRFGNISLDSKNGFGFGTGASLKAVEATKQAAQLRVDQAQEDQNRRLRRLEQELASLKRQEASGAALLASANENLNLFDRQYRSGLRQVMDVVSVYETKARTERQQIALKYDIARTELEIAREVGALVDGDKI